MRRRAFLATTAAAALACKRKAPPITGSILGPSMELGHRLRDLKVPEATSFEEVEVLIVGAGVAGLSAAWRLAGGGFTDFLVLELETEVGGTARGGRNGISPYPWGAHYVPAPTRENPALLRLLQEAGVAQGFDAGGEPVFGEQFRVRAPEERVFALGQWWEGLYLRAGASAEDERQYHAFFREIETWSAWRDARGRSAFAIPRAKGSDDPAVKALDQISFRAWVEQRGFTSERLLWLLDYACRDDYGARLDTTSAWAGLFYFAARKQGPGEDSRPLLVWPEGNAFLVEELRSGFPERIRTGVAVAQIRNTGPARIEVHALEAASGKVLGYRVKWVVFAGPQHVAAHVIPGRPLAAGAFSQSPWLVVNLTLRDRPKGGGFPLAWDNVIRESESLGYVVATHQSLRDYGPTVWTWYHPFPDQDLRAARQRLTDLDWAACVKLALEDLRKAHPDLESLVAKAEVMKWGHGMIRPSPGFCWGETLRRAALPHGGIHFAHTDLSGLALFEEAMDHGLRAAEEVLGALSRPQPSWR